VVNYGYRLQGDDLSLSSLCVLLASQGIVSNFSQRWRDGGSDRILRQRQSAPIDTDLYQALSGHAREYEVAAASFCRNQLSTKPGRAPRLKTERSGGSQTRRKAAPESHRRPFPFRKKNSFVGL
jgi:hypothetical protein